MGIIKFDNTYDGIISVENLLQAWQEFLKGKRKKKDVQIFQYNLLDNILELHNDLKSKTYQHGKYQAFNISDPKPRNIHKATVRDRLLHRAVYRVLYPFFNKKFIADSYSCRLGKGAHKAIKRFSLFSKQSSFAHTKTAWVLKCDIKKFFASVDKIILENILEKYISDKDTLVLLGKIIWSFHGAAVNKGLPLGNLTSQLLVNIYMNEFDQFMKHRLKAKYYIRYADDFVILDTDKDKLLEIIPKIADFLEEELKLSLHPQKVSISTFASGVDFLGWVHFPNHRVLRTTTKKRMFRNIKLKESKEETVQSYLGLLSHGNGMKLSETILKL